MTRISLFTVTVLITNQISASAQQPVNPGRPAAVEAALAKASANRVELEKALDGTPPDQRSGIEFLVANMPPRDLTALTADFLLTNTALAYRARGEVPWGKAIPEEIFLNDVLPYANVDEKRDAWRREFYDLCMPIARACTTPSEAVQRLNREVFRKLNVVYSTQRRAANQSPKESIAQGKATCTGLAIVLSDACRAVSIPARLVGTRWVTKRGNHTWVEIWDGGWHFTGACEPDPNGLDRGWFVGDAARAQKDSPEHAIMAASFRRGGTHYPLPWARFNRDVPGENVTDRYTTRAKPKTDTARVFVRVLDAAKRRIAVPVTVTAAGDAKPSFTGTSRGESADLNDFLTFELPPQCEYTVAAAGATTTFTSGAAGAQQTVEVTAAGPDAAKSAEALKALRTAIGANPATIAEFADRDFARVALTRADARAARDLLWQAHADRIRKDRADEVKARVLKDGDREMRFAFTPFGEKPAGGRSLWISMHGGGNAPARVNDRQWENQKRLYTLDEGIYLAPRAPTNTWNLWHEPHIDRLFTRLIEDFVVLEGVNPDRVYVLGYSAGGDGVYQIAPRMADAWAGAAMMAGHPNGVSLLSVRNVPFALQVGGNDAAYNRNSVARQYGETLAKFRQADPGGYEHLVKVHDGKGHWMGGEDKAALPWLAKFTRNPIPERVVWKQTGTPHDRFYWLAMPAGAAKLDSLVVARRDGQTVDVVTAEKVSKLLVRFDDRMTDLDKPVTVTRGGKTLFTGTAPRTIATMCRTLAGRGDPQLVFDAEIAVDLGGRE